MYQVKKILKVKVYLFIKKIFLLIFARSIFYKINLHVIKLFYGAIGINNYGSFRDTGELFFFKKISKLNIKTIFDIGANIGLYSIELEKHINSAHYYLFEPHPHIYRKLHHKLNDYQYMSLYNIGFSDQEEITELYVDEDKTNFTLSSLNKEVLREKSNIKSVNVNIQQLDSFIKTNDIEEVTLLKIDTEGNEYKILLGCSESLNKGLIKIIQFEFNEMNIFTNTTFHQITILLKDYNLFRILPKSLIKLDKKSIFENEIYLYQNIVAIHQDFDF